MLSIYEDIRQMKIEMNILRRNILQRIKVMIWAKKQKSNFNNKQVHLLFLTDIGIGRW